MQKFIKKKKLLIVLILLIAFVVAAAIFFKLTDSNLTDEERKQIAETQEVLKAGAITNTVSLATIQEIDASIVAGKNQEAKDKLYQLLENQQNLEVGERRSAYTALAKVCLSLEDFDCIDKVVAYQENDNFVDYFFMVDAARLAKTKNDTARSTDYYKTVYDALEELGGESYIYEINNQTQSPLDYAEIKQGAGQ